MLIFRHAAFILSVMKLNEWPGIGDCCRLFVSKNLGEPPKDFSESFTELEHNKQSE